MRLSEIRNPKDPFMHDQLMPKTGDIVQYADHDGDATVLNGKQGQVLDTPLYLKRENILHVIFDGLERASRINADRLTIINAFKA